MRFNVLVEMKNILLSYQPLTDYMLANLGEDFKHVIGINLSQKPKTSDYPFVSYIPVSEELSGLTNMQLERKWETAVYFGINVKDGNEKGLEHLLNIKEQIITAFVENSTLNNLVTQILPSRTITDEGWFQPFYHAEIYFEITEY